MKRLKFKKPFNGMDNAKKLIPESYKVDGNEFEITDGNETYRVKWSSLINEGIVLTSSNKSQINEDMQKMKHLMGFKSQDTLGTIKGAARLDENKKFGDVLDKTKKLINESEITEVEEEIDESIEEGEHIKSGMGGSNKGKSRTDKTEVLKKDSKKGRRKADKEAAKDINEIENPDVQKFGDKLNDNSTLKALISKINTPAEEIEAGVEMSKMLADSDPSILKRIARAITKSVGGDDSSSNPDETAGMGGIEEEMNTELPIPPSEEEEQAAQIYEDRFDEVFEGMYEEDDIETLDEKDKITIEEGAVANWLAAGLITIGSIAGIGKVIQLDNEAQEAKTEYYQNVLSPKIGDTEQMSELGHEIQDQTREMGMSVEMITSLSQEEGGLTKFWAEFADTKLRKTPQDFSVDQSGTIHYTPK